jgi:hypothetical protein
MNCIINQTVDNYLKKGRKIDVIIRYIQIKYRIRIEKAVLSRRMSLLNTV